MKLRSSRGHCTLSYLYLGGRDPEEISVGSPRPEQLRSCWAHGPSLETAVDTSAGPEPPHMALNTSFMGLWWENTSCRSSMESKGERGTSGLICTLHLPRGPKATELLTGLKSKWLKSWLGRSLQAHVHTQVLLGPAWLLKKPR